MSAPRLAILVNGGPQSAEAARARGLSRRHPPDRLRVLLREGSRLETARRWREELAAFKPDLLYVINTAMPGVQIACEWRARRGVPFVLDTGDAVFEMARAAGTEPFWKLPLLWAGERAAQRLARTIVVRGSLHREHLKRAGFGNVALIRDGCAEHGEVDPAAVKELRSRLGLEGFFVAGVMGSLVYSPKLRICYGWDLVRALTELRDLPVRGLVIGDGPGRPWLEAQAREADVADRLTFCGRIPYEHVPLYLRVMDAALSTQTNNLPGQVRTTGKLPEYMAAGRFILASRVGEAALVLPDTMLLDYHGAVDASYPSRLAARLRELATTPGRLDARRQLPARARELFSYEVLSGEFERATAAAAG